MSSHFELIALINNAIVLSNFSLSHFSRTIGDSILLIHFQLSCFNPLFPSHHLMILIINVIIIQFVLLGTLPNEMKEFFIAHREMKQVFFVGYTKWGILEGFNQKKLPGNMDTDK